MCVYVSQIFAVACIPPKSFGTQNYIRLVSYCLILNEEADLHSCPLLLIQKEPEFEGEKEGGREGNSNFLPLERLNGGRE